MDYQTVADLYKSLPLSDDDVRVLRLRPAQARSQPLFAALIVEKLPVKVTSLFSIDPGRSWQHLDADPDVFTSKDGRFYRVDTQCYYSSSNRYEALSYVWGELDTPCSVNVNNTCIPIGRNLDKLLRQIRSPEETILLWVDALCINQRDDSEKTVQVSNMCEIYKKAWQVTMWLGEESAIEDGRLALAFWSWLGSREVERLKYIPLSAAVKKAKGDTSSLMENYLIPGHKHKHPEAHELPEVDQQMITEDHVRSFLKRPWFRRRWVSRRCWHHVHTTISNANSLFSRFCRNLQSDAIKFSGLAAIG
jgi:hypothetical protein